jgi:hypothetical protein
MARERRFGLVATHCLSTARRETRSATTIHVIIPAHCVHYLDTVPRLDRPKTTPGCRTSLRAAITPVLLLAGCSTEVLNLGKETVVPFTFDPPTIVSELVVAGAQRGNPTLTSDLLEIYFTSKQDGEQDVWGAQRSARTDTFGPATAVAATVSSSRETSSAISQNGLSLWFGSDRDGGLGELDILVTTRSDRVGTWSAPRNLASLNSPSRDIPRPPGQHDLVMPMASDRTNPGVYQTMMASRPIPTADFGAPVAIPELTEQGDTADGFLTDDGLYLFLAKGDPSDLYIAQRLSLTTPFGPAVPLAELNTAANENDPWLSPDQTTFYFSSERGDGTSQIYVAAVHPRTP